MLSLDLFCLFHDLVSAGGRQAADNADGQRRQRISGGKVRHVDVHSGHPQQTAQRAAVIEADPRMSMQAVCDQMGRTPPWAKGLQLRADGYETNFYKKD